MLTFQKSKVNPIVILLCMHTRMLTFQNFCQLEECIDWTAALKRKEKNANLQRTQSPGIFPVGREEGGAGRNKGAGAGAGQKRAAPPSARVFAVMPAEKRARDDHGSGSVASDDAGATAHRDLRAALDVQGVERY
jgi:hypothetical protein